MPSNNVNIGDIVTMLGSFILIILVLFAAWYATRWYARRMGPSVGGRNIRVVDRATLANNAAIVIAEICGRYYLFGVSERRISLIQELPDFEEDAPPAQNVTFQKLFEKFTAGKNNGAAKEKDVENDGEPQ
jgi:flagellar biogenesis protein FliO